MTNQITQKFIDLLGPITDGRLHFSKYKQEPNPGGYNVIEMTKVQRELTEEILKEHFKFKEVRWMQIPGQMTDDGEKAIVARTFKLEDSDYETYEGKTGYVYIIQFTPKMYDPKTIHKPVKDGCTFGPLVYNPENFEPSRTITITFNPTHPDQTGNKEDQDELMKQQLRDKLEKILENPDAFMPEAFRGAIIRMAIV